VTTWSIGEVAGKSGLSQHTLRATGMPVRDMQRYAELVRSGAGEAERIELLKRHREEVRRAMASQRECLKLLDYKIALYSDRIAPRQTTGS
jgi:DNA-binding transcriptional MerR regulator